MMTKPVSFPAGAQRRGRESMPMIVQWIPFPRLWRAGDDTGGQKGDRS